MTTSTTSIADVTKTSLNTVVAVARVPGPPVNLNPQMGVSITLDGVYNVAELMQKLVDNGTYKQADKDKWLSYTDGWRMTWSFDTPSVVPTKAGAIDAVCISSEEQKQMICAGVTYIGVGSLKAQKWAKSSSWAQKLAFDQSKPLDGTDDTDNWYTSSVKFDGIWQAYRWLPKEQL